MSTIAVPTALVAFNWPAKTNRNQRVARFVDVLFSRIDDTSPVKARIGVLALSSPKSPSEPAAIPRKYEQGRKQEIPLISHGRHCLTSPATYIASCRRGKL